MNQHRANSRAAWRRRPRVERDRGQAGGVTANVLLALAVLALAVLSWLRPWRGQQPTEARLRERVAAYEAARRSGSVDQLFELAAPADTAIVGGDAFRTFYGRDMTRVHGVAIEGIDLRGDRATTHLSIDYELIPERMPAAHRRNLQVSEGATLRQQGKVDLEWVFAADDWHFRVDRVVLTGRDTEGRRVAPAGK